MCTSFSSFGEWSDLESKPISLFTLSQGVTANWAGRLLDDPTQEQAIHSMSCLHLCSHYNRNSGETSMYVCLGVKVNTTDRNMKYYICAVGLIYSYCGIHNFAISWLWSVPFFRLNMLLTFSLKQLSVFWLVFPVVLACIFPSRISCCKSLFTSSHLSQPICIFYI